MPCKRPKRRLSRCAGVGSGGPWSCTWSGVEKAGTGTSRFKLCVLGLCQWLTPQDLIHPRVDLAQFSYTSQLGRMTPTLDELGLQGADRLDRASWTLVQVIHDVGPNLGLGITSCLHFGPRIGVTSCYWAKAWAKGSILVYSSHVSLLVHLWCKTLNLIMR